MSFLVTTHLPDSALKLWWAHIIVFLHWYRLAYPYFFTCYSMKLLLILEFHIFHFFFSALSFTLYCDNLLSVMSDFLVKLLESESHAKRHHQLLPLQQGLQRYSPPFYIHFPLLYSFPICCFLSRFVDVEMMFVVIFFLLFFKFSPLSNVTWNHVKICYSCILQRQVIVVYFDSCLLIPRGPSCESELSSWFNTGLKCFHHGFNNGIFLLQWTLYQNHFTPLKWL